MANEKNYVVKKNESFPQFILVVGSPLHYERPCNFLPIIDSKQKCFPPKIFEFGS
jgi:hypothetical protein